MKIMILTNKFIFQEILENYGGTDFSNAKDIIFYSAVS